MMRGRASEFHREAALAKGLESEGWVLKAQRGCGCVREKIVRRSWKVASQMSHVLVRPVAAIHFFGAFNPTLIEQLQGRMAMHHVREMVCMQEALELVFLKHCRALGRLLGLSGAGQPNATSMKPWAEMCLNATAAMIRELVVEKQRNNPSLQTFKQGMAHVIGHLREVEHNEYCEYDDSEDDRTSTRMEVLTENERLWQLVHHVLCLLVRAACHDSVIPGYTPSVWAAATIAKGWAFRVPIEAKGWKDIGPDSFDLIFAHSSETNARLQLVSRGMRDAVRDSSAASRLKAEGALQRLTRYVENCDAYSARSARAQLNRAQRHRYVSPDSDRGYGSF